MKYEISNEGSFTIIALEGEVDLQYSPIAREQILKYLNGKNNVLVKLSGVRYIDSSGIASLVEGFQLAKTLNIKFGLVGVSASALQVIKLARLDGVFDIRDTVGDFLSV